MKLLVKLFFLLLCCTQFVYAKDLKLVTTIKPLHALIAQIIDVQDRVDVMIDGNYSPHNFSLRPSQVQKIYHSDSVILIDLEFEKFMRSSMKVIPDKCKILSLSQATDLTLYQFDHHGNELDFHVWLSIKNAIKIVNYLNHQFARINPEKADIYQKNSDALTADLVQLDKDIAVKLSDIKEMPFMVFHNAYQYFIKDYDLNYVGAITQNPVTASSIKYIQQAQEKLKKSQVQCVFKEPQYNNRLIETVIRDKNVKIGLLDPLGSDIKAGKAHYSKFMHGMADRLKSCLAHR